jgi:[acyl-carrier-protein] S-malonyltransferase
MKAAGVTKFIEIGPGKVLTGLVRQIDKEATYANIEDSGSLSNTLENLNN